MSDDQKAQSAEASAEPDEMDFIDRLGADNDPVQRFKRAVEACGGKFVTTETGWLQIENPCENLRVIEKPEFVQLICDKCNESALVEMRAGEPSEDDAVAVSSDDGTDEFFDRLGSTGDWNE